MFCEAFGLARIRVTFGHIHRHVGDTSGHIRHTRGTHWEHIVQKRVDTQENTGHTAKNGADTPDTSRINRGHIGFSTHAGHRRTHRGHIPTSQAHALNVLCPCVQPFCFLSQPDSFRFSATPTCFEMALLGQETPLLEERPKTSSFKTWALHDDFYCKNNICNL